MYADWPIMPSMRETSDSTARAVRSRFRRAESDAARLHLLETACLTLAGERDTRAALGTVLANAQRFVGADAALLLSQDAGGLTVRTACGNALPVGARVPVAGALATVLQTPMHPSLRNDVESRLMVGRKTAVAEELLLPLCFGGVARGVLALLIPAGSGRRSSPDDLRVLQALAVLFGGVLAGNKSAKAPSSQRDSTQELVRLTPREQQVFALLPRGLSNAEIAAELGIATGTAKVHVERILHKLGLDDRTKAAVRAAELGRGV